MLLSWNMPLAVSFLREYVRMCDSVKMRFVPATRFIFLDTSLSWSYQMHLYVFSGSLLLPAAYLRSKLLPFNGISYYNDISSILLLQFTHPCIKLSCVFSILIFKQVCHRDLKLENTLLDGSDAPRLKICDFGYSKVVLYDSM